MNDLNLKVGFDIQGFQNELNKTNSILDSWASRTKNILGSVGLAFGIREAASFGIEISKLAGEVDGVKAAFDRLPDSVRLLNQLRSSTHETVSELELMKRAVMASNFDISLKALPRLLEFATLRAQQTGQSVDYLVDSIVTGIGRKSKLILDNLGISASQLSAELHGASTEASTVGEVAEAVGRIAEKSLKNMAGFSENAASKMQQLNASWMDLKANLGTAVAPAVSSVTSAFNNLFTVLNSNAKERVNIDWNLDTIEKAAEKIRKFRELMSNTTPLGPQSPSKTSILEADWIKKLAPEIETIATLTEKLKQKKEEETNATGQNLLMIQREIKALEARRYELEHYLSLQTALAHKNKDISQTTPLPTGPLDIQSTKAFQSNETDASFVISQLDLSDSIKGLQGYVAAIKAVNDASTQWADTNKRLYKDATYLGSAFSQDVGNALNQVAYGFGQAMVSGEGFGKTVLHALSGFMQSFGGALIALGIAKSGLDKLFATPAGAAVAIAAGAALVTAAGALNASASSAVQHIGSGGGYGSSVGGSRGSVNGLQNEQRLIIEMRAKGSDLVAVYDSAKVDKYYRGG